MMNTQLRDAVLGVLPRVLKPGQYIGGEFNSAVKDHRAVRGTLCLSLLLGTPLLSLLGAVAAALTLGLRGAGVLSALLLMPLFVPVLIFGSGAVAAADSGTGAQSHLLLLAGLLMLALPLAPLAASAALRLAVDSA